MNTRTLIILLILLALLITTGYFFGGVYQSFHVEQQPSPKLSPSLSPQTATTPEISITASPSPVISLPQSPGPGASAKEKSDFTKTIHDLAQGVNRMTINECGFSPMVARVTEGSSLTFKNEDVKERRIRILDEFTVPEGESKTITVKFRNGIGVYGIICDNSKMPLGYLEIQPVK